MQTLWLSRTRRTCRTCRTCRGRCGRWVSRFRPWSGLDWSTALAHFASGQCRGQKRQQCRPIREAQKRKPTPHRRQNGKVNNSTVGPLTIKNALVHFVRAGVGLSLRAVHRGNVVDVLLAVVAETALVIAAHFFPVRAARPIDFPGGSVRVHIAKFVSSSRINHSGMVPNR
jgi:hypothetical protein